MKWEAYMMVPETTRSESSAAGLSMPVITIRMVWPIKVPRSPPFDCIWKNLRPSVVGTICISTTVTALSHRCWPYSGECARYVIVLIHIRSLCIYGNLY